MSQSPPSQQVSRLWTVDFVLDLLTAHFFFASYTALYTVIPSYVLDRGGQEWQIGVVMGSFGVVSVVVRPFAGRWIYRVGAKRIAMTGAVIFAVASFLYIAASSVWLLVPVRILQGIGMAMGPVATTTIVANLAPATRRAEAMSYMGNAIAGATVYAPVFGFWLLTRYGFSASFVYSASCTLLACLIASRLSASRTRVPASQTAAEDVPLINRSALFPTAVFLSFTITTAPVNNFLPLIAEDRALGNPGLYFTVNSTTMIFAMLLSGPIADRLGRPTVIVPGLLTTASAMFLLMVASNQSVFLSAAFLGGAGFGLLQPGIQSLTVDRVAPHERSSALATLQAAWDIGGSGGSFIVGGIASALGAASTFGFVGVATVVGTLGFVVGNARSPASLPEGQRVPGPGDDGD